MADVAAGGHRDAVGDLAWLTIKITAPPQCSCRFLDEIPTAGSRSNEVSSTDFSSRVVGPDHTVALVVGEDGVNANLAVVGTFANDKLATIK